MSKPAATRADELALPLAVSSHLPGEYRLTTAVAGDHLAIRRLLRQVTRQPSDDEFQAQLDEPSYEPTDRLLVKHGSQIVAHLRMIRRGMHFESLTIPVVYFADIVTQSEYQRQGCATALVASAERMAAEDGAAMGLFKTRRGDFYRRLGWHSLGVRNCWTASPRHLLSRLRDPEMQHRSAGESGRSRLHIRYWRQVEQAALMRLYENYAGHTSGCWVRGPSYWRWLVNRRGFDRLYVAVEGSPRPELDDTFSAIVAYAFERDGRIAELVTDPTRSDVPGRLLARICGDAIERDLHAVTLEGSPDHPLRSEFTAANGWRNNAADDPCVFMAKAFGVPAFVKQIRSVLCNRARQAGLPPATRLGLDGEGRMYMLEVTPRSARLRPARLLGRNYVRCGKAQLLRLLLGQVDVAEASAKGRLTCSTRVAEQIASALLPRAAIWFPPADDMPAK